MINMRRKTHREFIDEVGEINNTVEILSEYTKWDCRIKCRCKVCNNEWETSPSSLLQGCGCGICGRKKQANSRRYTHDEYVQLIKEKNRPFKVFGKYTNTHAKILFECLTCGNIWESDPTKILNGSIGCPMCGNSKRGKSNSLTQIEFVDRVTSKNPNIEILGNYENNCTPIRMRCKKHDLDFIGNVRCILYKGGNACPKCNESLGEQELSSVLDEFNIRYETQFSIDECRYENKLRFDAFDIKNNIAYEYQGEQHYMPIDFAGKGEEWAEENLKLSQARDNAKREYCEKHGIPLIEIPYWEKDNMRDFLIDKWKDLNLNIA